MMDINRTKDKIDFVQWNIVELTKNNDQVKKLMKRNDFFTSFRGWESVVVEEHKYGYYYIFEATQCKCCVFVNRLGQTIRKPKNSKGTVIYDCNDMYKLIDH